MKLPSYRSTYQRWTPRGHILKSLALASKSQVLENCPVLGSKTALFFESLKFCRSPEKIFWRPFFVDRLKKKFEDLFFENTCASVFGPWPRIFFCVLGLGLELCVLDSTTGTYMAWGPGPLNSNSIICLISVSPCQFLFFRIKLARWRWIVIENGAIDGYVY